MQQGNAGFKSYYDAKDQSLHWIAYEPVPSSKWTIAAFFSQESLDLPTSTMHKQKIWILLVLC